MILTVNCQLYTVNYIGGGVKLMTYNQIFLKRKDSVYSRWSSGLLSSLLF